MKSFALKKIENTKLLRSGISSKVNVFNSNENKLYWEQRNQTQLLNRLKNWQFIIANFLKDGVFASGVYEYYKINKHKTRAYSVRVSEILLYLDHKKHFSLHYTKVINNCSQNTINSEKISRFIKEAKSGVVIDGNRIFPEIYFPFMDEQYFNHFDWNKKIIGVAITDLNRFVKDQFKIIYISKPETENKLHNCACNKQAESRVNKFVLTDATKDYYLDESNFYSSINSPILFIGYTLGTSTNHYRELSNCFCSTAGKGDKCGFTLASATGNSGGGTFCWKVTKNSPGGRPCAPGDPKCETKTPGDSIYSSVY